jgi:hypothetical protein
MEKRTGDLALSASGAFAEIDLDQSTLPFNPLLPGGSAPILWDRDRQSF